ncbi:hypothetical protein TL16_g12682 [Triparma laevis f. inornata]|uniref:U-box domain-containing protein n=2 Tax=Triparma laevis TaxID=1534972 RepID=A0A9W7A8L9_9STRA|nr:hypothetical protein TrLO_g12464 [Triparma laevis f. longispina]GMH93624.1 hypothetical protein TL16_g12682 [Triparma laevis f. inornata]
MTDREGNVDVPSGAVQPLFPHYLGRVKFDTNKVVLASSLPVEIIAMRNVLIRWIQFELAETFAALSFGFVRTGIAKTSLFLNILLLSVAGVGLYAVLCVSPLLIAFHAITLGSLCVLFGLYIFMIAASGDESWWLLMAIFAFITVDYVVAWKAIKFLRLLMKYDKTLTEDSPLLMVQMSRARNASNNNNNNSGGGGGGGGTNGGGRAQTYANSVESQMLQIENFDTTDAPNQFMCPISLSLMVDPVVAMDGHTYERMNIENWFKTKKTSPLTRAKMKTQLIPNQALKSQIQEYLDVKRRANDNI